MEPRKLDLLIATFPYSGNGGIHSQAEKVSEWVYRTVDKATRDPRIERVSTAAFSDTPITMTRNHAVQTARKGGIDLLLMVDSDMWPDKRLAEGDPTAKAFWDTSFDLLYEHWEKGPLVIGAPYCGPPPRELAYVFQWANWESDQPNDNARLEMYQREQAALMTGIGECAALPTGLILFDVRAFELTTPEAKNEGLVERMLRPVQARIERGERLRVEEVENLLQRTILEKEAAEQSWFYYEWTDRYQTHKGSTEDVTATRDISLLGFAQYGYNPLRVNWDAWAGHFKVKCVDKPSLVTATEIGKKYLRAARKPPEESARRLCFTSKIAGEIDWSQALRPTFPGNDEDLQSEQISGQQQSQVEEAASVA